MKETVLVTGSTSGIGKAIADRLAGQGCNLILVSRDADRLGAQCRELQGRHGIHASFVALDLSVPGAAQKVFETVQGRGESVQILVNNAGFNEAGEFLHTDGKRETEMISLHAVFPTEMMKLFIPSMVEDGYGRVLNVGSTGSFMPCPHDAVYAATKAYVLSVSRGINAELKKTGVRVTVLCPGSTRTRFAERAGLDNTWLFRLFVMDAADVAAAGCRALKRGRDYVVPGVYNRMLVLSSRILPFFITGFLAKMMLKTTPRRLH